MDKDGMLDFVITERTNIEQELKIVKVKLKMVEKVLDKQTKEMCLYRKKVTELKKVISFMESLFEQLKKIRGELDG